MLPRPALPAVCAVLAIAPVLRAQEVQPGPPFERPAHDGTLGGDWGGLRTRLAERGVELGLNGIVDTSWPFSGGLDDRVTTRALWDVALEADLERALGWRGGTIFAQVYAQSGRDASEQVGDVQAFSNIDAENVAQLSELWFEHVTRGDALRLKVGKADANADFAMAEAGLPFAHSSAGFSPTIFAFPTYPDPAVSLNAFARLAPGWQLGLGLYNAEDGGAVSGRRGLTADFEAAFAVGELDRRWGSLGGLGEGRLALGAWGHTGELERFDGGDESGTEGYYALLEQRLSRERGDDAQGLVGFLQWGVADGDVSEFEQHVGLGLLYTGLLPGRDDWHTGLYLSHVALSDQAPDLGDHELAVELFQDVVLLPGLTLKPDLQPIVDPSGRDDVDDAWVLTLRLELSL